MIREFGRTAAGAPVQAVTLAAGDLRATVLTYGAILQDVRLAGVGHGLTLGSDWLGDYEGVMRYHGALIGPVANRIAGAQAVIGGRACRFEANEAGNTLHSGHAGCHAQIWRIAEQAEDRLVLALDLADGDGGFPGNRWVRAVWQVAAPATLTLSIEVDSDAETLVNFTNHSYWTLDGGSTWAGHRLRVAAEQYLPVDAGLIPTGEIAPVAGTALDLRAGRVIAPGDPAMDTNFCLSSGAVALRDVLWLTGQSGVAMVLATTEPGVQVYDSARTSRPGHAPYEGLAFEPQGWPDAPNQPGFPSVALAAGGRRLQQMQWRFRR